MRSSSRGDSTPKSSRVALSRHQTAGDAPGWVSVVSIVAAAIGIGLAGARTLPAAQRLGARVDPLDMQHRAGRGILRDHLVCLAAMVTLLVTQLAGTW